MVIVTALTLGGLFYLQFGLQALSHHRLQGVLALIGAAALIWGATQRMRRASAATVVFLGTLPVLVLHVVMTLEDAAELPFLIGSLPAPLVSAAAALLATRGTPQQRESSRPP